MTAFTEADIDRWYDDGTFEQILAIKKICKGALQKTASGLIGQRTQEQAGESELYDGVRLLEEVREKRRAQHNRPGKQ